MSICSVLRTSRNIWFYISYLNWLRIFRNQVNFAPNWPCQAMILPASTEVPLGMVTTWHLPGSTFGCELLGLVIGGLRIWSNHMTPVKLNICLVRIGKSTVEREFPRVLRIVIYMSCLNDCFQHPHLYPLFLSEGSNHNEKQWPVWHMCQCWIWVENCWFGQEDKMLKKRYAVYNFDGSDVPRWTVCFFCAATWMCSSMNMMKGLFFHQFGDQKQRCKMVDVCRKRSPKLQSTLKLIWYPSGTDMLSTCCSWVVWLNPIPQAYPILIR